MYNNTETLIPEKDKYPVIRNDYQCIDHVSLILSNDSIHALVDLLDKANVEHSLAYTVFRNGEEKRQLSVTGVTVAYSQERIPLNFINRYDLDIPSIYFPIPLIECTLDNITITQMPDNKGNLMDVIEIHHPKFNEYFNKYIEKGAEWSLGPFRAFIRVNQESRYTNPLPIDKSLYNSEFKLVFDTIRFMRFGELKE